MAGPDRLTVSGFLARFAFALLVVAGLACYGLEMVAILRARKRRALDWGLKSFLTAVSLLAPLSMLALVLSWPSLPLTPLTGQLENVYGFIALLGVVSFAIIGMFYKIIPFLVWYGSYSREIGLRKVPSLGDLYSPGLQALGHAAYLAGLALTTIAIVLANPVVVRCGCALVALSFALASAAAPRGGSSPPTVLLTEAQPTVDAPVKKTCSGTVPA